MSLIIDNPLISVIVPVYNAAAYLRECVDSILAQEGVNLDVILVNDCSTDGSDVICHDYEARNQGVVRVFDCEHRGLSASRNTGIGASLGDYICFVDADDMLFPGALSYMVDILENTSCEIVSAQMTRNPDLISGDDRIKVCKADEAVKILLYQKPELCGSAWAKLYRKSIFDNCTEWFADGRYYEDLEIMPRLFHTAGEIAVSARTVYYYRPNQTSFLNNWSDSRKDVMWVTEMVCRFVAANIPSAVKAADSRRFSAAFNMFGLGLRHGDAELAGQCWGEIRRLRLQMLSDGNVRFKNKLGALLSLFGRRVASLVAGRMSRMR